MRRIVWVLVVAVLLLTLSACNDKDIHCTGDQNSSKPTQSSVEISVSDKYYALDVVAYATDSILENEWLMFSDLYNNRATELFKLLNVEDFTEIQSVNQFSNKASISLLFDDREKSERYWFRVFEDDKIEYGIADYTYFQAQKGTFQKIQAKVKQFEEEDKNFYKVKEDDRYILSFELYKKDGSVFVEEDTAMDVPHIKRIDENLFSIMVQTGTGSLSRWTGFYDYESEKLSTPYCGLVESYGDIVCTSHPKGVSLYKMFSDEAIAVIDDFEKGLADFIEPILDVAFSKDGTQLLVWYWNSDEETSTQVFNLEKALSGEYKKP